MLEGQNLNYTPPSKNTHKYTWQDSKNKFSLLQIPQFYNPYHSSIIQNLIQEIEKKSGIKKRSSLLTAITLILFCSIGFLGGFFLIKSGFLTMGGVAIIITPILGYFLIIGYEITRGTQVERFNTWMAQNKERFDRQLQPYGLQLGYSVNKCNFFIS